MSALYGLLLSGSSQEGKEPGAQKEKGKTEGRVMGLGGRGILYFSRKPVLILGGIK